MDKRRKHLIFYEAGVLTVLVFFFAIIANGYLDEKRADQMDEKLFEASVKEDALLSLNAFQEEFQSHNCETRKGKINSQFNELKKVGTDISNYGKLFLKENENQSKVRQRSYFLSQFDLYLYTLDFNEGCDPDIFPVIYFFNGESTELDKQAIILEQFALNNKNQTIIFSYDAEYENEILLDILKEKYDVSSTPFLIMNNKTSHVLPKNNEGLVSLNTVTLEFLRFRGEI